MFQKKEHHMPNACPISGNLIDESIARVVAIQVSVVAFFIILFSSSVLLVALLLLDFLLRYFRVNRFAPTHQIAKAVAERFSLKKDMRDESPKRFALALGLGICFVMLLCVILKYTILTKLLGSTLLACALLEALFGFCVGCRMYRYIKRFT